MFLLGLLSIAQMLILPGHVVVRALRLPFRGLAHVLVAIPTSLALNHFLVVALVLVHAYRPGTVYAIVVLELAAAAALAWRSGAAVDREATDAERLAALARHVRAAGPARALVWWSLAWLAGVALLVTASAATGAIGTVFSEWDAVVSWNRWATSWAGNAFPTLTWHYPQLLPTNVSLTYVLTDQQSIQLFAKATMGVFPIGMLLMLADVAVRRRSAAALGALATLGAMNWLALRPYLVSGYADLPVAFMVLASIYVLVLAGDAPRPRDRATARVLAVVLAASAALTKQGAVLWAAASVLVAALDAADELRAAGATLRERAVRAGRLAAALAAIALAIAGPWYAYKSLQIRAGKDEDERVGIVSMSRDLTYGERAIRVNEMLRKETSDAMVLVVLPLLVVGALCSRRWRRPVLLYGIPHLAICVQLTNYDLRNLAPAWPVLITAGWMGWADVLRGRRAATAPAPRASRPFAPAALGAIVAVCAIAALFSPHLEPERLTAVQDREQRQIGYRDLNAAIYEYYERNHLRGKVVTDYMLLEYLPGFAERYVLERFKDVDEYRRHIGEPDNRFVLAPVQLPPDRTPVANAIEADLASGRLREVFQFRGYRLSEISGESR